MSERRENEKWARGDGGALGRPAPSPRAMVGGSKTGFSTPGGLDLSEEMWYNLEGMGSRLVAGQRTLDPSAEVRILPPQPEAPSSSGLGRRILDPETGVRLPLGL